MFRRRNVQVQEVQMQEVSEHDKRLEEVARRLFSPTVPEVAIDPTTQASYEAIAESLGFTPTELTRDQMIAFFAEKNWPLYDYESVCSWLTEKRKEAKKTIWCWRPLREKDVITEFRWGRINGENRDGYYDSSNSNCQPYARLVPIHALEKVRLIEERFGGRVKFFISDYATVNVDPFIMVRPAAIDSGSNAEYHLVFDYWDKPGYAPKIKES